MSGTNNWISRWEGKVWFRGFAPLDAVYSQ